MPRARTQPYESRTAAASDYPLHGTSQGSGCLSGYVIPPLAVVLISCLLAAFAIRQPVTRSNTAAALAPAPEGAGIVAPPEPTPFFALTPTPAPPEGSGLTVVPVDVPAHDASGLSPIFTPEVQYWGNRILRWSAAAGVDPNLAAVVMQIESCGHPRARSSAGAMGLFQVMPFHFQTFENGYDPDTNARRGLAYLARSLEAAGGDARLALAGYNGGIGVIARAEWTWSAQTQRYVRYGAPMYADALSGSSNSAAVEEWFSKYGASLCRQARQYQ